MSLNTLSFSEPSPVKSLALAKLKLPHPYLNTYLVVPSLELFDNEPVLLQLKPDSPNEGSGELQQSLHREDLHFVSPRLVPDENHPPTSDNSLKARFERAAESVFWWKGEETPKTSEIWLIVHAILILQPNLEIFRVKLSGCGSRILRNALLATTLAYIMPGAIDTENQTEVIISRSAFWQGAASPFGVRSPWTPAARDSLNTEASDCNLTSTFPDSKVHQLHPRRSVKPSPGTIVYSRYIPSLDEHFSLLTVDYKNEEHLKLFHKWQNDPRVAREWKETGTLEQHRAYLKSRHDDPHTLTVFGRFNDISFSYFEIYWAKEDPVGAYYESNDYDRGRLSLVGDARFRGRHRVLAWWSCIIHFCFLDDHRTDWVIGEPAATNNQVLVYDFSHGLHIDRYIELPHKRAALVKVSRERFFQTCPLYQLGGFIPGTAVPLPSRL